MNVNVTNRNGATNHNSELGGSSSLALIQMRNAFYNYSHTENCFFSRLRTSTFYMTVKKFVPETKLAGAIDESSWIRMNSGFLQWAYIE